MDARIRSRSLILSLLVHTALIVALIFAVMTSPIPPFPETGGGGGLTFVDIGTVDESTGDMQPMSETTTENPSEAIQQPKDDGDVATQDHEESPVVKEKKDDKKKQDSKPVITPPKKIKLVVEPPRTADPRSIYKGKSNNSTSQGTANAGTGDQGARNGDPNSLYKGNSGTGGGTGNGNGTGTGDGEGPGQGTGKGGGVSFSLTGRKWSRPPVLSDQSQETGKVVVDITVDKDGNVITATPGGRGSTTTSSYLLRLAKDAAMKAKFNSSADNADVQSGSITFIFVLH